MVWYVPWCSSSPASCPPRVARFFARPRGLLRLCRALITLGGSAQWCMHAARKGTRRCSLLWQAASWTCSSASRRRASRHSPSPPTARRRPRAARCRRSWAGCCCARSCASSCSSSTLRWAARRRVARPAASPCLCVIMPVLLSSRRRCSTARRTESLHRCGQRTSRTGSLFFAPRQEGEGPAKPASAFSLFQTETRFYAVQAWWCVRCRRASRPVARPVLRHHLPLLASLPVSARGCRRTRGAPRLVCAKCV